MEANFRYNTLKCRDNSVMVTIPNNDIAKLMYYLECVSTVLKYDGFYPYTEYENYDLLTSEEEKLVIDLAFLFNPKIMVESHVFGEVEDLDIGNRFFEIQDETMNIHANDIIVIGGITTRVLKVMLYRPSWLYTYYFMPLKRLIIREQLKEDICNFIINKRYYTNNNICSNNTTYTNNKTYSNNNTLKNNNASNIKNIKKREDGKCCVIF